ncbi:MAG: SAM-dependent methyltransferase [Ginsengibacter sp.]
MENDFGIIDKNFIRPAMELSEILQAKIKKEGPLSFRNFMDMALYYPSLGYYNSEKNKIGKEGDFYTSPVLSSLFGEMIGKQIEEMWLLLDKKPFTLVEYGAGTGALCEDIIDYLKSNQALYQEFKYCIIEKSETMQKEQKLKLTEKVSWHHSISELSPVNGCILSNEILDNFPVHKVIMKSELMEVIVDYHSGFIEELRPANEILKNYFKEQNIDLPENYGTEINLQAIEWIKEISTNLNSGFVLTIDYGFSSDDLYSPKRNSGTLACYNNHNVNFSFYHDIGKQDITAHVNFSALNHWGKKYGLQFSGFTTQANFLRSLGLMNYLRKLELQDPQKNRNAILQIQKLLIDMGNKFKVLVQQKGVKSGALTGMQFADPL